MENKDKKHDLIVKLLEQVRDSKEEVYSYAVPNIFSKKLASFTVIREDILFAKSAFETIQVSMSEHKQLITASLFYAAIIQYGRCFNENKGNHSKLEPSDIFLQQHNSLSENHAELMNLRNSFVAHRDDNEYEQAVVIMQIPKADSPETNIKFNVKSSKTIRPSAEQLLAYIHLCDFLIDKIEEKIQKACDKTKEALFKNLDLKQIENLRIV